MFEPRLHQRALVRTALVLLVLVGCRSPGLRRDIAVTVAADGGSTSVSVPPGSSVSDALLAAGIDLGELDMTRPPSYTILDAGSTISVVRVQEEFKTEQVVIPFDRQSLRNEALPEGETRLVQPGVSGLQELTYRLRTEDGVEISRSVVKTVVLREAQAEILMVGAQAGLTPLSIAGVLAYLSGGKAWLLEGSTSNSRLLVASGDLDGRIFTLSPNGDYLIYTRKSKKPADQEINTLWAISTRDEGAEPVSLRAANVVHFAGWIPGTNSVAYSTVEPRAAAPGWQANNDLFRVSLSGGEPSKVLEASAGGVYGWWGMSFSFSEDGRLAYSRPDQVGLVDIDGGYLKSVMDIVPYNTHSDWAWVPAIAWGADGETLYVTTHSPATAPVTAEDSPRFDLTATSLTNRASVRISEGAGMFAYTASHTDSGGYAIAFLRAILPDESDRSRYGLNVMDRDGSNRQTLFPASDAGGLEPQIPAWAPAEVAGQSGPFLAVVYEGDVWLIDSGSGRAYQGTADGTVTRLAWQ